MTTSRSERRKYRVGKKRAIRAARRREVSGLIAEVRSIWGYSQAEIAGLLGVPPMRVSVWARGKTGPAPEVYPRVVRVLNELARGHDEQPPPESVVVLDEAPCDPRGADAVLLLGAALLTAVIGAGAVALWSTLGG